MEHKKLYNLKFMARSADSAPAAFQSEQWTVEGFFDLPDSPCGGKNEAEVALSRMSFGYFYPTLRLSGRSEKVRRELSEEG